MLRNMFRRIKYKLGRVRILWFDGDRTEPGIELFGHLFFWRSMTSTRGWSILIRKGGHIYRGHLGIIWY